MPNILSVTIFDGDSPNWDINAVATWIHQCPLVALASDTIDLEPCSPSALALNAIHPSTIHVVVVRAINLSTSLQLNWVKVIIFAEFINFYTLAIMVHFTLPVTDDGAFTTIYNMVVFTPWLYLLAQECLKNVRSFFICDFIWLLSEFYNANHCNGNDQKSNWYHPEPAMLFGTYRCSLLWW